MLSSLCFVNLRNLQFCTFLQNEWNALMKLFTSEVRDFAESELQELFNSWEITASEKRIMDSWMRANWASKSALPSDARLLRGRPGELREGV
jgi:hypothetical protein